MSDLRRLVATTLIAALPTLALASTRIDPGQTFALGGEQTAPVQLEGRNDGPVAVELLRRRGNEPPVRVVRAEPGQGFRTTLPAGTTALARNTSTDQPARVRFVFNGQIDRLSMRYEAATR